jgi:hypothetical protein
MPKPVLALISGLLALTAIVADPSSRSDVAADELADAKAVSITLTGVPVNESAAFPYPVVTVGQPLTFSAGIGLHNNGPASPVSVSVSSSVSGRSRPAGRAKQRPARRLSHLPVRLAYLRAPQSAQAARSP